MSVILTSPVEGKDVGETYSGDREDWLVAHGYAARTGDFDGVNVTDVPADKDPTLPENREAPPAQGVDAYLEEDGEAILGFDRLNKVNETTIEGNPELLKPPAGLEGTDRRTHGTVDLNGVEQSEDKHSKKFQTGAKVVDKLDADDARRDTVPQADFRPISEKQPEADKESEKVVKRAEKVLEKAETDIPETSINAGVKLSDSETFKAQHRAASAEGSEPAQPAKRKEKGEDGGQSNDGGVPDSTEGGKPKQ